jgi:hypothetical protein
VHVVHGGGLGVDEVSLASRTVAAPSVSGVELPAVIVASALSAPAGKKTGLSLPSFSTLESARRLLSLVSPR